MAPRVDAKARERAVAEARRTGTAQAVKGGDGKIAYYVDAKGKQAPAPNAPGGSESTAPRPGTYNLADGSTQTVRADGSRIIVHPDGKRMVLGPDGSPVDVGTPGRGDGGVTSTGKTQTEDAWDAEQQRARDAEAAKQAAHDAANDPALAQQRLGRTMLVGGVSKDPVDNPDPLGLAGYKRDSKTGQLTDANGQQVDPSGFGAQVYNENQLASSTFAALNLPANSYNGNDTFLFSKGGNGYQNMAVDPTTLGNRMDDRAQAQNEMRGQGALTGQQNATNYMTIAQASQWLANLSVNDKQVYNEMVVSLNKGGYFAAQSGNMNYIPTSQLPMNTYSRNTGAAFVEAAKDLAVAQKAGYAGDMKQWLADRSTGYEDYVSSGAGYNPVNRALQDPATLALSAKTAAQHAIGRNLTPAEEAKFEAAFHGKENTAYNEIDQYGRAKAVANFTDKSGSGGGPTSYTMPDASGEADQFVNQDPQFAQEKQGYQSLELTKGLIQFLKGTP